MDRYTIAGVEPRLKQLFRADRTLFHADRFHPNARGYATWVPVLMEGLAAGR